MLIVKIDLLDGSSWSPRLEETKFANVGMEVEINSVLKEFEEKLWEQVEELFCCREFLDEAIIDDPLAYYIPHHAAGPAIVFKLDKMQDTFRRVVGGFLGISGTKVSDMQGLLGSLWNTFVVYVFWHEFTHHIIDDVSLKLRTKDRIFTYGFLPRKMEEGFCEYMAFSLVERFVEPPQRCIDLMLHHIDILSKDTDGIYGNMTPRDMDIFLGCIFYSFGRNIRKSDYYPIIRPGMPSKLKIDILNMLHRHIANPIPGCCCCETCSLVLYVCSNE